MRIDDPTSLERAPLEALDEAWAEELQAGAPESRRAWLRAADGLRDGPDSEKTRARIVYWALRDELDPVSGSDAPRILHVLRSGLQRGTEFAELAERAAGARDARLRLAGQLCVAQCRSVVGEFADAEQRFLDVLSEVRGGGTRLERTAYASLAVVYQNQGREFEALVLTRIVLRLSAGAEDRWEACVAHQQHCALLDALGDWDHMEVALDDLEAALVAADPPWAWRMWRYIHGERAEAALERDDLAQARISVRRMREVVPPGTEQVSVPSWHPLLSARLALAEGRPAAALERVAEDAGNGQPDAAIVAIRGSLALGDVEAAVGYGRVCLDMLESEREIWGGAAQRLRAAASIATLFEDHEVAPVDVRRAYDVAAEAAMRRIFELEHTLTTLPDLAATTAGDMAALESFRLRFRERHARLLDRLAGYLADQSVNAPFAVRDGHLRVCAWCHRLASRADHWLPVGHLLPVRPGVPLTHTICPECVATHGFA